METGEIISLPADSPRSGGENIELNENGGESGSLDFQPGETQSEEDMEVGGISGDDADGDNQPLLVAENGSKLDELPTLQISFECSETVVGARKSDSLPPVYADHLCLAKKDEALLSNQHELPRGEKEISASPLSGVKRPRLTVDEEEPLVRVSYRSLTRDSKRKLKELLQEWSQWHAQHCSSSTDSGKSLESGEDTYFPAIQVGLDKSPALPFWMENERRDYTKKELISVDEKSVPIYDRGFSLALTSNDGSSNLGDTRLLEVGEGSHCSNCGSYSHTLKECPKPRDNVVVNNAQKQHMSRRGQNGSSHTPTRYYQDTPENEVGEESDEVVEVSGSKDTKKKATKLLVRWTVEDDITLCGAWFIHSTYASVGTGQNAGIFWSKIVDELNQCRTERTRSLKSCKGRWQRISHDIAKFVGCESKAIRHYHGSGASESDIISFAQKLFAEESNNQQFSFFHCYTMCKGHPKFLAHYVPGNEYSPRPSAAPSPNDECATQQYPPRPISVKAAKCKAKVDRKSGGSQEQDKIEIFGESNKLQESSLVREREKLDWTVRKRAIELEEQEKNRVQRERDNQFNILQVLLAKEVLSPTEEELRSKIVMLLYGI